MSHGRRPSAETVKMSHLSVLVVVVRLFVLLIRLRQHLGQTLSHPADDSRPAGGINPNLALIINMMHFNGHSSNHTLPFSILPALVDEQKEHNLETKMLY